MSYSAKFIRNALWLGTKVSLFFLSGKRVKQEDIAHSYHKISKHYQTTYLNEMHRYNDSLLEDVISTYGNVPIKLLDLAGGTGYNCMHLKKQSPRFQCTLVDASKAMINACKDTSITCIHGGMCASMKQQESNTFDVILCTWALMYEKPQQVLKECYRILKPCGKLYILVNDKKTLPQIRKTYPSLLINHVQEVHTLMMDLPTPKHEKQLQHWGKQVGFTCIKMHSHAHEFHFSTHLEAVQFVCTTGALAGYDVMLDLHNKRIQKDFAKLLETQGDPCITHHFIHAIFQKKEDS